MSTQSQEVWVPEWTFGDRLRKVRRDRKISQREAAQALEVKESQIASWETAANTPRDIVAVAKRCQLAWSVPAEWMLGLEMHNTPGPDGPEGERGDDLRARRYSKPQPSDPKVLPFPMAA